MVAAKIDVVGANANNKAFPEAVREGVVHLVALAQRGIVEELVDRVRIQRTGFMGFDGLVYLILYASMAARDGGLRAVWGAVSSHSAKVAGIVGREALPSSSAMSRLLAAATLEEVRGFSRWLLVQASGVLGVMREPITCFIDGAGRRRRLFAFDPVRIAVRWRGCPEGEDLPSVRRRSEELVAPGHTGRKRGEAVVSIGVIEDLGTSAVIDATISRGNGDGRMMFSQAVDAVAETMGWLEQPVSEALLLADGEFGWVPYFDVSIARNVPFLTRCSRYEILDRPDVRARLAEGPWTRVTDSGGGPTRWAVEIGTIELDPGRDTRRDDGARYQPVKVRIVASRYDSPPEGPGCGHQIGDHRVELFASHGVHPSSLAANDVVSMFYARCGQENSFLQQKKLGVHRVVSNTLAGQLFAAIAAFFVWNLRIVAGVQIAPPLPEGSVPAPRVAVTGEVPVLPPLPAPIPPATPDAVPVLADALGRVDWAAFERIRLGWRWIPDRSVLLDPSGHELVLSGVERHRNRRKLRFLDRGRAIQATLNVPEAVGIAIATALRGEPPPARPERIQPPIVTPNDDPPTFAIRWPELRAAAARNAFKEAARQTVVTVRVPPPPTSPQRHPLVEESRPRRQHRRLTWKQRIATYAARAVAAVSLATPDGQLAAWLRGLPPKSAAATART